MVDFNGLGLGLGTLPRLSNAQTRSVSAENFTGEKGRGGIATEGTGAEAARDLGRGWKVSPSVRLRPGDSFTLADIRGSGAIQQIWITTHYQPSPMLVLRFHWDGDARPAVEVPLGDFFCNGWGQFSQVSSLPVAVNPNGGMNCFWEMPFRTAARITLEHLARPGNFPIGDLPRPAAPDRSTILTLPEGEQRRLNELMDRYNEGELTSEELEQLRDLVMEAERIVRSNARRGAEHRRQLRGRASSRRATAGSSVSC